MKKNKKMGRYVAAALSASMAVGNMAAPLNVLADNFSFEDDEDGAPDFEQTSSNEDDEEDSYVASPSNAVKETKKKSTPKTFGSTEFWDWFNSASEDEMKDWYESIEAKKIATGSDAKKEYVHYVSLKEDPEMTSEFWTWLDEEATTKDGQPDYDVIFDWLKHVGYDDAIAFLNDFKNIIDPEISTLALGSSLFPSNYGTVDWLGESSGDDADHAYILDTVDDLRGLARLVANGNNFEGKYIKLTKSTYDLNNCWIPIGFSYDVGGSVTPFRGHIAASNKTTITNLGFTYGIAGITTDIASAVRDQESIGFFGKLDGATVEGITIQTGNNTVSGREYAGILAGYANDSVIKNCTVTGNVRGNGNRSTSSQRPTYVGGIVGFIESSSASNDDRDSVIEDCKATDVAVYISENQNTIGGVGGIAGYAKNTIIADSEVKTNDNSGNHIYGDDAYVGGIVGIQEYSDLYNVKMVSGSIGSNSSYAVGGLVGGYNRGQLKVGQFSGTIIKPTNTNRYDAAFIGTRINNAGFVYGDNGDIAYLFTDSATKAQTGICGSKIDEDTNYGKDAHIGYWNDVNKKYTLVTGNNIDNQDDYYYQELERGILNIKKTGHFTHEGDDKKVIINHYTADAQGNPVRGYLLTVIDPTVDGKTASKVTATVKEQFKQAITSDQYGAFAAGDRVYVTFDDQKGYKIDPKSVNNPYYAYHKYKIFEDYVDDASDSGNALTKEPMTKSDGYWITMPSADTIISADYKKVAMNVDHNPDKLKVYITQTRTGSRENPDIKYTAIIKDQNGSIVSDGNGNTWNNEQLNVTDALNPTYYIRTIVDGNKEHTFTSSWAVYNGETEKGKTNNIISNMKLSGGLSTDKVAGFKINLTNSAISEYIEAAEKEQADNGYRNAITTSKPLQYHSYITSTIQSDDAAISNDPPVGTTDVDIYFNIVDNTKTSLNGATLSTNQITYNVVRTLSGDRTNPTIKYTINGEEVDPENVKYSLQASFNPDYFSGKEVNWYLTAPGSEADQAVGADENKTRYENALSVESDPAHLNDYHYGRISLIGIPTDEVTGLDSEDAKLTNTFISGLVKDLNANYTKANKQIKNYTTKTLNYDVKVSAHDENNNVKTDTAHITVNFNVVDNTEIHPTQVTIDQKDAISYDLAYTMESDINSNVTKRTGFGSGKLTATVLPDLNTNIYNPYNKKVVWSSSDSDAITIDPDTGAYTINGGDSDIPTWIKNIMNDPEKIYAGSYDVTLSARAVDQENGTETNNQLIAQKVIHLEFHVESLSVNTEKLTFNPVYTQDVMTSVDDYTQSASHWTGDESQAFKGTATSTGGTNVTYKVLDNVDYVTVDTNGNVNINKDSQWIQDIINGKTESNSGTVTARILAKATNTPSKVCIVTINFRYDATKLNKNETTLNVVATQGNNTIDQNGTRTWTFDSDQLSTVVKDENGISSVGKYSVSDNDLLSVSEDGTITPKQADWMNDIVKTGMKGGNHRGSKVVYVTSTSKDGKTKDVCKVTINFRYDNTVLNKTEETFDVVLTNNSRTNSPKVTWSGLDSKQLSAKVYDDNGVAVVPTWESEDNSVLVVDKDGRITPVKDAKWMKDLIAEGKHSGTKKVVVNAINKDGSTKDSCTVTINFRYDDVELSKNTENYTLVMTQKRRTNNPEVTWSGNITKKLDASVWTSEGKSNNAIWQTEDSSILTTDQSGNITPVINAKWMLDIVKDGKFEGQKITAVDASSKDKNTKDSCNVTINFKCENVVMSQNSKTMDVTITASGRRTSPTYTITGDSSQLSAIINSINKDEKKIVWSSSNSAVLTVDANGKLAFVAPKDANGNYVLTNSDFIKGAINNVNGHTNATTVVINAASADGRMSDQCNVTLNLKYVDNTYTSSSGGGGGGGGSHGGGGGGSSSGVTPSGTKTSTATLPSYVVTGTWVKDNNDKWLFTAGRTYTSEWAAIHNPYADISKGQSQFDWFRFDENGYMVTGWFTDKDGNVYYLNPVSDNTQGRMFTGWNWITGSDGLQRCYFFKTESDGTRGSLYRNTTTPDGYTVDATGAWTVNGQVVTRTPQ